MNVTDVPAGSSLPESPATAHPIGTILAVDDSPENLSVLGELLQPRYRVLAATNGAGALAIAAGETRPDLILLDVMMPEMDGYAVLARLRDDPATRDIPVIFVTALDAADDEVRGLELGAVDYIPKPFRPAAVLARVHTHLELKRARDRLRGQNDLLEAEVARRLEEYRRVQDQLLLSEKLALLGQLVAGIAHEINNPVSFVNSNLTTLRGYVDDILRLLDAYAPLEQAATADPLALERVERLKGQMDLAFVRTDIVNLVAESVEGLTRVRTIVQDLKETTHAGDSTWNWADLNQGLRAALNIVWNELKYKCEVHEEYGELPPVWCVQSQLDQVFMNLLVNAAQAIPERGTITLRTARQGDDVLIEVHDTGTGIAPEHLERLFEPFFTTKPSGKGTGLGLSLSYSIVHRHHGRIEADSTPGQGSTFRVVLPTLPQGKDIPAPA